MQLKPTIQPLISPNQKKRMAWNSGGSGVVTTILTSIPSKVVTNKRGRRKAAFWKKYYTSLNWHFYWNKKRVFLKSLLLKKCVRD